jgi:hypothetical protein
MSHYVTCGKHTSNERPNLSRPVGAMPQGYRANMDRETFAAPIETPDADAQFWVVVIYFKYATTSVAAFSESSASALPAVCPPWMISFRRLDDTLNADQNGWS